MRDLQFYTHEAKRCVPYLSHEDQLAWAEHALETHPGFGSLPQPESTPQPVIEAPIVAAPIVESPDPVSYPPAPIALAPTPQRFGFVDWWRIAVLILLLALCVINARAQDPASQGIILGFQQSGTTLAQRGTGIVRFNCSTGMTCSWTAATSTFTLTSSGGGGGSPGGLTTQVQYNNSGSFGGITNLTSDGTNPILKAIAAPSSPSSGFGIPYEDSTSLNLAFKNAAGTVNHGIQTKVAVTHNFATAVSDAGVVAVAQPACADLSDAASGCSAAATPPGGAHFEIQTNNGSGGFAGSNWFINANDLIYGDPTESSNLPYLIPATNQLSIFPSQNSHSLFYASISVPSGGHGSDTSEINLGALATADSTTKFFASQLGFGGIAADGSTSTIVYQMGMEGVCTTANDCSAFSSYDFTLVNTITNEILLENSSTNAHGLYVPATTQFVTLGLYTASGQIQSNDTTDSNPLLLSKNAVADSAPGAGYVSFKAVAGTTSGKCKIVMKAGTSATPITLIDDIGSGC